MGIQAFTPMGATISFTAATSAPTGVQAISTTAGGNQYRIINSGTVVVFLGIGITAGTAQTNAGATATSIPLLPGTDEILSFSPNAYFSGATASSTAVVYITPGDGM